MPISITTQFPSLVLSAALPDIVTCSLDQGSTTVSVMVDNTEVFTTTLYAFGGNVTLYDIRTIIEDAIRENNNASATCSITFTAGNDAATTGNFTVVMSNFIIPNPATFLDSHFLTTRNSFQIQRSGKQSLSWFSVQGENIVASIEAIVLPENATTPIIIIWRQTTVQAPQSSIYSYEVNVPDIAAHFESQGKLLSFTVQRGMNRYMSFYVTDEKPNINLFFLNAFNVTEYAELYAATTTKQKATHSEANCLRNRIFYDRNTETTFEVETTALQYDEALWLNQLLSSRYVAIIISPGTNRQILITETESEISDSDPATSRHKFTYKFAQDSLTKLFPSPSNEMNIIE